MPLFFLIFYSLYCFYITVFTAAHLHLLASGGSSGEVILSDVFANRSLRKVFAHDMGVSWLQFANNYSNADKFLLATVGPDDALKL